MLVEQAVSRIDRLNRGRLAHAKHEWREAYAYLSFADFESPMGGVDLAMLAETAYMLGSTMRCLELFERAYQAHIGHELPFAAARCAFWIGTRLQLDGDAVLGEV